MRHKRAQSENVKPQKPKQQMKTCVRRCVSGANSCFCYSWSSCKTHPHLLYRDDVRAKHFKATGEEHDITPAEDQTHRHHLGLPLHLTDSEHQQQHHQAGIADTGKKKTPTARLGSVPKHYALLGFSEGVRAYRITWKGPPSAVWPK